MASERELALAPPGSPSTTDRPGEPSAPPDGAAARSGPSLERVFAADGAPREPRLLVDRDRTALPAIERAWPVLSLFPKLLGRHWATYKVALLKDLQANGAGRWRINEIKALAWWLHPSGVSELVGELRDAGLLLYEPVRGYYRLTGEARVVASILDSLTIPELEPRRMIKFIAAAVNLGLAAGAGGGVVAGGFATAVAVLREDLEELQRLADDGSYAALLEAAEKVREHVADMDRLLTEHEAFREEHRGDRDFMGLEQEALALCALLADRAAGVISLLTSKADELMRGGARLDRGDIREFVLTAEPVGLAGIMDGLVAPPPYVPWLEAKAALDALLEKLGRSMLQPPPLPEPEVLERTPPPAVVDPVAEMALELDELTAAATLTELTVADAWPASVARYATVMEAVSRRRRLLPRLDLGDGVEEPRRGGVWRISRTTVHPHERADA